MNYSALFAHVIEGSGGMPPGKFWISGLLKPSLMRFLSNMAETCYKLAVVCALLLYRPLRIMHNIYVIFNSTQLDLFFLQFTFFPLISPIFLLP